MTDQNPPAQPDPYQPPSGDVPPPPPAPQPYGGATPPPPAPGYGAPGAVPPAAPSYVQPGYGPSQNGSGTAALVLGLVGLLSICCGVAVIASILAVVFGAKGKKLADQGLATNRGAAQAGVILGWIGIGLAVVYAILIVVNIASGNVNWNYTTGT